MDTPSHKDSRKEIRKESHKEIRKDSYKLSYKTISLSAKAHTPAWVLIDAREQILGRLTSRVAALLRGKHKPYYTPHMACGDRVVITHAADIRLTGKKWDKKLYIRHTGYPGGQRERTARQVHEKSPIRLIEHAVRGMLPKNRLGRTLFRNLHVYEGGEHPHQAQTPQPLSLS